MTKFNSEEILRIAEQIERNGAKFYRRAVEIVSSEKEKELFRDLAEMEDEHETFFIGLRNEIFGTSEMADFGTYQEYDPAAFLSAVADGYVFDISTDPGDVLKGGETSAEILRMAIQKEKDTIVFYLGIKAMVPEELGKGDIDTIIREEMSHVSGLSGILKEISD